MLRLCGAKVVNLMIRLSCCVLLVVSAALLSGQHAAVPVAPYTSSASLLPRDIEKGYAPMTVLHADSQSILYKYLLRERCPDLTYCYRPLLARVSHDLEESQMLPVDLTSAGGVQTYFTLNQLGDRINVYHRRPNRVMGRVQYTATTYRADNFQLLESAVEIGSVATDARGQVAGAHFRTNTRTGQLATLLQDIDRYADRPAPIRTTLFDSLHQVVWRREIDSVDGHTRLDVIDAMVRNDGRVATLVRALDTGESYLVVVSREGLQCARLAMDGAAEVIPALDYQQGASGDLFVFGKYLTASRKGTTGMFLMKFNPDDLSRHFTARVPITRDATGHGLALAGTDARADGGKLLDFLGNMRFLPTPDGGGYLTGGFFRSGETPGSAAVRYGTRSILRFDAAGGCTWVRNLYRSIEWAPGASIQEQAGVHQVANDLIVIFNQHADNAPLTAEPLKNLTSIPAMESVLFRVSSENEVSCRRLLSYKLDRTILVPPVTSLSTDGTLLHAAIEKPLGYRKIYAFKLNW